MVKPFHLRDGHSGTWHAKNRLHWESGVRAPGKPHNLVLGSIVPGITSSVGGNSVPALRSPFTRVTAGCGDTDSDVLWGIVDNFDTAAHLVYLKF